MPSRFRARDVIGAGLPGEQGARLAEVLLRRPLWGPSRLDWSDLTIDATCIHPSVLISAFFLAFLQKIGESDAISGDGLLDSARNIKWELEHDFQRENVGRWMENLEVEASAPVATRVAVLVFDDGDFEGAYPFDTLPEARAFLSGCKAGADLFGGDDLSTVIFPIHRGDLEEYHEAVSEFEREVAERYGAKAIAENKYTGRT